MYYVYLLKSRTKQFKNLYIGYTSDLKRRIEEHNSGLTYTTRQLLPVELIYYEAYKTKEDAKKRERALKWHGKALGQLKRRLEKSLM